MATPFPRIRTIIEKRGQLAAAPAAWAQRNVARFGPKTVLPASKTIAARFVTAGEPQPKSKITGMGTGTAPNGFGKSVSWAPEDAGLAVVVFLNAGDLLGVSIQGVQATDTIEFVTATGIASFAEETENKDVGAFIGILAAGATLAADVFGAPELAPVIDAAAKFAESRFEQKKVKTKRRDPFGEDNGEKARQEGGVIVSLPRPDVTTQIYYSGNDDHQERWIKKPGTRDTAHLPDHVKTGGAFFLQSGKSNKRRVSGDGNIIIAPWDHIFEDNFGFYRLDILLKRGSGKSPVVD